MWHAFRHMSTTTHQNSPTNTYYPTDLAESLCYTIQRLDYPFVMLSSMMNMTHTYSNPILTIFLVHQKKKNIYIWKQIRTDLVSTSKDWIKGQMLATKLVSKWSRKYSSYHFCLLPSVGAQGTGFFFCYWECIVNDYLTPERVLSSTPYST